MAKKAMKFGSKLSKTKDKLSPFGAISGAPGMKSAGKPNTKKSPFGMFGKKKG